MRWNFLFLLVISLNISAGYSKENLVAIAIKEYAENNFVKNGKTIEIFYNSKNVSLVDETIKLLGGLAYRVTQLDAFATADAPYEFNTSAILIFDKLESFTSFERNVWRHRSDNIKRHLLIVCPKLKTSEVVRNLTSREQLYFPINQYLIEEKGQIFLKELTWFTPQAQNKAQLIEINRFSNKKLKWRTTKFSNANIDNFHGCTLKICYMLSTFLEHEFNWTTTEDGKVENIHTEGFLFNLAKELSRRLNFTMETWLFGDFLTESPRFLNLTEKKEYKEQPGCDWVLLTIPILNDRFQYSLVSKPIFTDEYTIIVPPGAFYTSEEKFILPFDELTWILLAFTFLTAFSVVIVVRLSRSFSITEFVIGENVSTPGLNIVAAFMGIGQLSLPARNVSRMLLMNFVIFSLIMRTAYQGVYFEFLTTNPQKKPISSMEEIAKKNIPVYTDMVENFRSSLDLDVLKPLTFIDTTSKNMSSHYAEIQYSSFDGCIFDTTINLERNSKYLDTLKFNYLDVNIFSVNLAIQLHPSFDPKVVNSGFIESGILENWSNRLKYFAEQKVRTAKESNLVVLSMDDLATGFTIWLCALSLSVIAFIAELCHFYLKRTLIRLTRSNRISFVA